MGGKNSGRTCRAFAPELIEWWRKLRASGMTYPAISAATDGTNGDEIRRALERRGIAPKVPYYLSWTDQDTQIAVKMRDAGCTLDEIGRAVNRSPKAVRARFRVLAGSIHVCCPKPEPKTYTQRKCLRCLRMFPSEGPGHRRCDPCAEAVRAEDPVEMFT